MKHQRNVNLEKQQGGGSTRQGGGSKKQGGGSKKQGGGSKKQGGGSKKQGARFDTRTGGLAAGSSILLCPGVDQSASDLQVYHMM